MAERAARDEFEYSVASLPPTLRHRRLAFAIVVVTLAAYGAVLPFERRTAAGSTAYLTVMAIVFVTDLVTAVSVRSVLGNRLTRPADARERLPFFFSLIAIPYTLPFRAFGPTGPPRPDLKRRLAQVSARFGLAIATVGCPPDIWQGHERFTEPSPRPAILWSLAIVIVVVCTLTRPLRRT